MMSISMGSYRVDKMELTHSAAPRLWRELSQASPFRAVCKAPFRVNPDQAPAFMPESRRVDFFLFHVSFEAIFLKELKDCRN